MRSITNIAIVLAAAAFGHGAARAQDAAVYIDDRSDGPALIKSLYNAINHKEFARAYSYFGDKPPVGDYRSFVQGYADTVDVQVITGTATSEGAAGSVYTPVPVAIRSTAKGGKVQIFAGCYITRIISPAIQEPPFTPLQINSAELEQSDKPFENALPKVCHSPS